MRIKMIAETAWHHEGDFCFMQDLVQKICEKSKADYIKLHLTLDMDEYMLDDHDAYNIVTPWMLTEDEWMKLISMVRKSGKELMLLLNDTKAIEFAAQFSPELVEIHSVCLNVPRLQNAVKKYFDKTTTIVIGVGGCSLQEVDSAVQAFQGWNTVLMFGFQNYPTKYADVNLTKVRKIQSLYLEKDFGYADHTGWDEPNNELITMLVAANGMKYVEKHVTTAYGEKRCDYSAAISIEMFNSIADRVEILNQVCGDGSLTLNAGEKAYSQYGPMKMAPIAKSNILEGEVLSEDSFSFCRTGQITDMSQIDMIDSIGSKVSKGIAAGEVLCKGCLQ